MFLSTLRSFFRRRPPIVKQVRKPGARLGLDVLEDRSLPSVTLLANDNWVLQNDNDSSGTLTPGDTVNNSADAGTPAITGTLGVNAFTSIGAAVGAAAAGDTVQVLQGTYNENVVVQESITLIGPNTGQSAGLHSETRSPEAVIVGGIMVDADNVTIDGFTINGGANFAGEASGIFLASGASEVTIENNIITGTGAGRGILSAFNGDNDNLVVADNNIGHWTTAIFNQSNTNVDVTGNYIHDNFGGVANDFVADLLIQGNLFANNEEAIATFQSTDVEVHFNNLAANDIAIQNYGGEQIDASFNDFGTTIAAEIAAKVLGDVSVANPLTMSVTGATRIYSDNAGTVLQVDTVTGAYALTLADGSTISGSGARIQNGVLKIHDKAQGTKLDVKATADGEVAIAIRGKNSRALVLNGVA